MPISHCAHKPLCPSAILLIDHYAYQPSGLLSRLLSLSACYYRAVGENPTKEELQDFINMIDKEATGFIKFPDFLFMMASKVPIQIPFAKSKLFPA